MPRIRGIRRLFRFPLMRSALGREVDDEIAFHIHSRIEELRAAGLSEAEARHVAQRRFGDLGTARADLLAIDNQRVRRARLLEWRDAVSYDLGLAARGLARAPALTATLVAILALGIGVNAAMFGMADRLLLQGPPHVRGADRLVRVMHQGTTPGQGEARVSAPMPYADYAVLRDEVGAFSGVAAYSSPGSAALGRGSDAAQVQVATATASFFTLLGVEPALGRFYADTEDAAPRAERVVVLGHGLWRRQFGSDPAVLGRSIEIENAAYTVVGVAPRGFHGIDLAPVDAWIPVGAGAIASLLDDWHQARLRVSWLNVVARLAPGVTEEAAVTEANGIYRAIEEYAPQFAADSTARLILGSVIAARAPTTDVGMPQRSGRLAAWLFGVSLVVLVIACANVANLLLARGLARRREAGVRIALGASRWRLALHVVAEALMVTALGGALGLVVAYWSGYVARKLLLPELDWTESPIDGRMLAFTVAAAIGSATLAGLLPAIHACRTDAVRLLAPGGRGATYHRSPLRSGLIVLQVTLSVLLLVGAGLFVRSLHSAHALALGYSPDHVTALRWQGTRLNWPAPWEQALYERSLARLGALRSVDSAAMAMTVPMSGVVLAGAGVEVPGIAPVPRPPGEFGYLWNAVSPTYFRTMGTRLLRGRDFTGADAASAMPVAIITSSMARLLWPAEDALGKCFWHHRASSGTLCRQVVGVVEDLHHRQLEGPPDAMFFVPLAQAPPRARMRTLVVRTRGDSQQALRDVRRALYTLEPGLPPLSETQIRQRIDLQLRPWQLGASLFSGFGGLALLLASIGLYGVVSYDVAQRMRELAVRVALGARSRNVLTLVFRDALRLVAIGLAAGVALAVWLSPRMEALLFGGSAQDWVVLAVVAPLLLAVGVLAVFPPALRALHVQPVQALRDE